MNTAPTFMNNNKPLYLNNFIVAFDNADLRISLSSDPDYPYLVANRVTNDAFLATADYVFYHFAPYDLDELLVTVEFARAHSQ